MRPAAELRHVLDGPGVGDTSSGAGLVEYLVAADDPSVLNRARDVLRVVLEQSVLCEQGGAWPDLGAWREALPPWFVAACAPDQQPRRRWWTTRRHAQQQQTVDAAGGSWTLAAWLSALEPDERSWFWWGWEPGLLGGAVVLVEVDGWPYADGCLRWLLAAAGATAVETD